MKTQPIPDVDEKDVERVVERDFSREYTAVMTLLNECGIEKFGSEAPRVRLACLKLAGGSFEKLRKVIDVAKVDWRDVLASAEYPEYGRKAWGKKLPESELRQVYEDDWKQYRDWLTR